MCSLEIYVEDKILPTLEWNFIKRKPPILLKRLAVLSESPPRPSPREPVARHLTADDARTHTHQRAQSTTSGRARLDSEGMQAPRSKPVSMTAELWRIVNQYAIQIEPVTRDNTWKDKNLLLVLLIDDSKEWLEESKHFLVWLLISREDSIPVFSWASTLSLANG